jgi:hypothetical protein
MTIRLYHGTDFSNDITKLRLSHPGNIIKHGHQLGFGIYATPDRELAKSYGKYLIPIDYELENAISDQKQELTIPQIKSLIKYQESKSEVLSNFGDQSTTPLSELVDIATKLLLTNNTDLDLVNDLANVAGTPDDISVWLVNHHFNHAYGKQGTIPIYVLYDLNQFKIKS